MRSLHYLLILLAFFISSCNRYPKAPPKDFNFSLSYGCFGDEISTFDSTFATSGMFDSTSSGSFHKKIIFTMKERNRVYQT
jgi:hypothetical protein